MAENGPKTAQNGKNGAQTMNFTNFANGAHEAVSIRGWFSAAVRSAAFRLGSKSHAEAWTTYEKARGLVRGPGAVSAGKNWPKNGQNGPKIAHNCKNGAETTNFTNFANGAKIRVHPRASVDGVRFWARKGLGRLKTPQKWPKISRKLKIWQENRKISGNQEGRRNFS